MPNELRLKSVIFDVAGLLLREKFRDEDGKLQVWRYPGTACASPSDGSTNALTTGGKTAEAIPANGSRWHCARSSRIYTRAGRLADAIRAAARGILLPIAQCLQPRGIDPPRRFHHVQADDFDPRPTLLTSQFRRL